MNPNRWRNKPNNNNNNSHPDSRRPSSRERGGGGGGPDTRHPNPRRSPSWNNGSRDRSSPRRNHRNRGSPGQSSEQRHRSLERHNSSNHNRSPTRYNANRARSPDQSSEQRQRSLERHNSSNHNRSPTRYGANRARSPNRRHHNEPDRRDNTNRQRSPHRPSNYNRSPPRPKRPRSRSPLHSRNSPTKPYHRPPNRRPSPPSKRTNHSKSPEMDLEASQSTLSPTREYSRRTPESSTTKVKLEPGSREESTWTRSPLPPRSSIELESEDSTIANLQKELDFHFLPRLTRLKYNFAGPRSTSSTLSDKKADPKASLLASEIDHTNRTDPNQSGYLSFTRTPQQPPLFSFPSLYPFSPVSVHKKRQVTRESPKALFVSCLEVTKGVNDAKKVDDKSVDIGQNEVNRLFFAETTWGFEEPISCVNFYIEAHDNYKKGLSYMVPANKSKWSMGSVYFLKSILWEAQSLEALRFMNQPIRETLYRFERSLQSTQRLLECLLQYSLDPKVKALINLIIGSLCYTILVFWRQEPILDLYFSRSTSWYLETASATMNDFFTSFSINKINRYHPSIGKAIETGSLSFPLPTLTAPGLTNAIKFARSIIEDGITGS